MRGLRRKIFPGGKRGHFQALFGLIYLALGLAYLAGASRATDSFQWLPGAPAIVVVLSCGWVLSGLLAVPSSLLYPPTDRFGLMAMSGIAWSWAVLQLASWATGHAPTGWIGFFVYLALGAAVLSVSGMIDPRVASERA